MNRKRCRTFTRSSIAIVSLAFCGLTQPLAAQDVLPKDAETFDVGGNHAFIYAAPKPAAGKPWVWYAPTLKNLAPRERKGYYEEFAMAEPELVAKLAEFNPIDNLQGLLANKVPMFAVHGDKDGLVPYDLNTKILKERYEAGGGSIQVKVIPDKGHQVDPAFFACQELIDFVLKHAKSSQP